MEIFIDSANIAEIQKWLNMGIIDGATTNPSIMLKDGVYDIILNCPVITTEIASRSLKELSEIAGQQYVLF